MITVVIALIAAFVLIKEWIRRRRYSSLQSLPSPPRHWLLGNIPQILEAVKEKKLFQLLTDWAKDMGPIYVYWIGRLPVVILSDPKAIEDTIINGMRDGSLVRSRQLNRAWNDISGPILLGKSGVEWQWRRKAWNPEFTPKSLSNHLSLVEEACLQVVNKIECSPTSAAVEVDPLFVELTMRVISSLLLGVPVNQSSSTIEGPPLDVDGVYHATSVISYRFLRVATGEQRWRKYLPSQSSRDYWDAIRYLEHFLMPRIDLALSMRSHPNRNWDAVGNDFKQSMLMRIVAKEPKYSRAHLMSESIELLIAGTDTTAHSLSFATAELSLNPDIYQKAQRLIDTIWDTYGGITVESLKELNYIRAIFKETLRLYSVASGSTSLEATREFNIRDTKIPRGTRVFWSTIAAGRDASTYPNPEEFFPERWLEMEQSNSPLIMIDFGSGAHRCLGEHLATLEATVMLTMMLRYFDWELVNGRLSLENLQQNLLIYPPDKMPVRFTLREHAKVTAKTR